MENVIRVEEYRPVLDSEGKETNLVTYVKQKSLKDVEQQLREALKSIYLEGGWDCNALEAAEWVSTNSELLEKGEFPNGEPIVVFREGSSEGYLLQVICHDRSTGNIVPVFSVKYLSDEETVWFLVRCIHNAFK